MQDYKTAEEMLLKSITVNTKVYSESHAAVAKAYYMLAEVYWNSGRLQDAEPYALKSLEIRERVLGANHLHVALSLCGLGGIRRILIAFSANFRDFR